MRKSFLAIYITINLLFDIFFRSDTLLLSNDNHVNDEVRDSSTINKTVIIEDDQFMKYGLWITTIIFLSLMLACQIIATGLCVLNTVTVPIEAWVGPMGIYCANAAGGTEIDSISWIPFHIKMGKIFQ